jgi:hypothetical protein
LRRKLERLIPAVRKIDGTGEELHIHVRSRRIASDSLREFIAVFQRYHGPMDQLAQFESEARGKLMFGRRSSFRRICGP